MKTINVTFEDAEFEKLVRLKAKFSWQVFILKASDAYQSQFSIKPDSPSLTKEEQA